MDVENCRHLLGDLSDFLDGEASEEICTEIERHMSGCEDCQIVVDTLRKTVLLYRELPPPPIPDAARERLYRALDLEAYICPAVPSRPESPPLHPLRQCDSRYQGQMVGGGRLGNFKIRGIQVGADPDVVDLPVRIGGIISESGGRANGSGDIY